MIFLTTTSDEPDFELANRCLVLAVNEDRDPTRAIHRRQREGQTLQGLLATRRSHRIAKLHQDAQRLLRAMEVINPYGEQLTFLDNKTRLRRDYPFPPPDHHGLAPTWRATVLVPPMLCSGRGTPPGRPREK